MSNFDFKNSQKAMPSQLETSSIELLEAQDTVLSEYEHGFRELGELLPHLVWTCGADGSCTYFNQSWTDYTGLSITAPPAVHWADPVHPEDKERTLSAWNVSIATGTTFESELRWRRFDGAYGWFKTRLVPVRNGAGQLVKWLGTSTDINDQKQAEEALRHEKERFTKLTEAFPGIIFSYRQRADGTSCFPYAGKGIEAIYGYTPEELREDASPIFAMFHPDDMPVISASIVESGKTMSPWQGTWRVLHPQRGEIWLESYSMPVAESEDSRIWHGVITDITLRKQSELAAAHLAAIVESSEDAIIGKNLQGMVTSWNTGAEKVFGYSAAEMVGQRITKLIPPDRQFEEDLILGQVQRGLNVRHFDTVRRHKNGNLIDVSVTVSGIKDGAGKIIGASKMARDITERKRFDNALRLSEEHLRLATEAALMGTWERDLKSNKLYWSASMERLMGFEPGTFPGTFEAFYALVHPDSQTQLLNARKVATHDKGVYWAELHFKLPDGRERWGLVSGQVIYDAQGKPDRIVGVDWDITERKLAEEALNKSQAQLEAVFQSIQDGIVVTDIAGDFLLVNEAEARICGFASPADMKRNYAYFGSIFELYYMNGTPVPIPEWPISRLLRGESIVYMELRGKRLDTGQEWVFAYTGEPVYDAQGKQSLAVLVMRDITESKEAEQKIRRLNEELEQRVLDRTAELAAVNKELEAFSYSVSHDLRAPLRHINGFSQALLEDYADKLDDLGKSFLREVRNASTDMAQLIDDVLQLARVTRSEMHRDEVNLTEVAAGIIQVLQKRNPQRQLTIEIEPDLVTSGDKRLLEIMLSNLLENAWKFTSKKDHATIAFGQQQQDGQTVYFVRDNGAGFDMAYVNKLFAAFQRLHSVSEFEGTGIGLAIVKRVVTRHRGNVWCEGAVNQGATFFFTFPATGEKYLNE